MNFNDFSKDPQTTAAALKIWFIETTALTVSKIANASGQTYYRHSAFKYIEENAYYELLDTVKETIKETNAALDINMDSNKNGNPTGWAQYVLHIGLTHGVIKFAKKALVASAK